jgi:hypothetical protein
MFAAAPPPSAAPTQAARVGRIIGHIDGISRDGDHVFVSGWACQQRQKESIAVHVFGQDPQNPSQKALLIVQYAGLYSEPSIGAACQDRAGAHRFFILLPFGYGPDSKVEIHGIRVAEGVSNDAIEGSGKKLTLLPAPHTPSPDLPRLAGQYHSLDAHPGVFMTQAELEDLVTRINRPGSYSMQRFGLLAKQIKSDLTSGIDWNVTYAGCDGTIYNYTFGYEPQDHREAETRKALQIAPGAKAPAGAAVVASRLALYAALVRAGAAVPQGGPRAEDAAAMAKRILLAWADHGFPRDPQGHIQPLASKACGPVAKPPTMTQPRDLGGLVLGRGLLYSAHAQDLLQSLGSLSAQEVARLNEFHAAMFETLRQAGNAGFGARVFQYGPCTRYNNIAAHMISSMLATARLLDDRKKLNAVLYGDDPSVPVLVYWIRVVDGMIYGERETHAACGVNQFPDSEASLQIHAGSFETPNAAPGEITDRNRSANPGQGFGYSMITLGRLFDMAELLRLAGFDSYGYRGARNQSIEMAMQYYACYAKGAGFYQIVTAKNSGACPNAEQYYGRLVTGVDQLLPIGALRFPENTSITGLEAQAKVKSSLGGFSTDAILFGKWRD